MHPMNMSEPTPSSALTGTFQQLLEANDRLRGAIDLLTVKLNPVLVYAAPEEPSLVSPSGSNDLENAVWENRRLTGLLVELADRITL